MADWPDAAALRGWLGSHIPDPDPKVDEAIAGARGTIEPLLDPLLVPAPDPSIPDGVRFGCLLLGARYYALGDAPLGKVGTGEFQSDIMTYAPDAYRAINAWTIGEITNHESVVI